ncbi:radial spoke head 14 homolog [Latimeria chalumnae]|uniref:Radial spoke head 14 homolog n=1 Tax=Latimeria chalumnae TaxID=7897 RepID=H3BDH8_LATCH|nr:PREDICTED: radial spoke head 14 homolog isoform X2 [Latimeria chalumnae]XP_014344961.1 PREDICTED: radial spoke head 14 homolog isoform X2 [Latimeria chalumnae]|eukprot:XP_014344956.1 PREDICTED: radial spoke head 14 homolog isoform X2 [Latimeria chalumnae]
MAQKNRISAQLPPLIDPTKTPIAFGHRALPKLNEELQSPELLSRQRALMALCDLAHDPEIAYQAVFQGCLENLKALLKDEDSTVRQKTTEVLYIIATHSIGRHGFLIKDVIVPLSMLLDEPVNICRWNMHKGLVMLSQIPAGALGIVEAELVPRLVRKLEVEVDEIQELILDTLYSCLRVNTDQALEANAVSVLKSKLTHESVAIRSRAAQAFMGISVPLQGKDKVYAEGVIPLLVELLNDSNIKVRAKAAGALMTATITTQGKYAALNANAIGPLLNLVNDATSSEVRLNVIKAITTLSEAPEGRKELLASVHLLQERQSDENEAVRKAADTAVQVITWKP